MFDKRCVLSLLLRSSTRMFIYLNSIFISNSFLIIALTRTSPSANLPSIVSNRLFFAFSLDTHWSPRLYKSDMHIKMGCV